METCLCCEFGEGAEATEFVGDVAGQTAVYETKAAGIIKGIA